MAADAAERLASSIVWGAELEPKLTLDVVAASCPVQEPSTPVSAGCAVSDDGEDAAEVALVMGSSAAAVRDAAGSAEPPVELEGNSPGFASSMAAVEPVPSRLCVAPPRAHVAITLSAPAVSATPVGRSVEDAAWL